MYTDCSRRSRRTLCKSSPSIGHRSREWRIEGETCSSGGIDTVVIFIVLSTGRHYFLFLSKVRLSVSRFSRNACLITSCKELQYQISWKSVKQFGSHKDGRMWWQSFLGEFAELRKATILFVVSVLPSAQNNSAPTKRIFIKFSIFEYFSKICR